MNRKTLSALTILGLLIATAASQTSQLARSIKFTVAPDGKFDNGIATANKLGSDRVIVLVQIIGDQDGQWNRAAWKTEAFYGNPLTGFTPSP